MLSIQVQIIFKDFFFFEVNLVVWEWSNDGKIHCSSSWRGGGTVLKPFTLEGGKKDQLPVACINMVTCTYQLLLIRNLGGNQCVLYQLYGRF